MTGPRKSAPDAAARERYEQAMVDADIEGLARDPEAEKLSAEMDTQGIPIEEQISRLKVYFSQLATV